jgi:hypothetical protein
MLLFMVIGDWGWVFDVLDELRFRRKRSKRTG